MTTNRRFSLTEDGYLIDRLNPRNNNKYSCEGNEDDRRLRERVLWCHLADLVQSLIVNRNPMKKLPNGETYRPRNEEVHSISWAIYKAIKASHLNTLDVALSLEHRWDGQPRRKQDSMQDNTSLFVVRGRCRMSFARSVW
jgi:hypothetical protein